MEKTKEQKFNELQAAYQLTQKLELSIRNEMSEKAKQRIIWENGRCEDWKGYETACHNFDALVIKYLS